ncbi:MAG: ABC transporter substrate-binding protein [Chloroflexi bacterium]|nr:ABC transporter substrate-binding protein [Chloroflexota bacterium]
MKKNSIVLVAILVVSALLAGCGGDGKIPTPAPTPEPTPTPMSFTDDAGNVVNLLRVPQRIVSIGPMITEILVALGASEKIVGVDDFSQWPSTGIPIPRLGEPFVRGDVISPKLGIDPDAIVALHPDMVIANVGSWVRASEGVPWGSQFPFPGLDKAGIPTVCLNPVVGVTGTLKRLLSLGAIVGESDKANELVTAYEKRKLAVLERVQDLPKVRVVLAWGHGGGPPAPGPPVTEDDPLSELIQLAGGVNVFTSSPEDKNMVQQISQNPFTLEPYIAKNPEVILVLGGLDQWQLDRPGWEKVDAVQIGRVHAIGEITPLTVLDRLEEIARLLHPT